MSRHTCGPYFTPICLVISFSSTLCYVFHGRPGGLIGSALVSGSSSLGFSPGQGHCVVFLGKRLNSHSASLSPCVPMDTGKLNLGVTLQWNSISSRQKQKHSFVAPYYRIETRISTGLRGHLACMQTLPFTLYYVNGSIISDQRQARRNRCVQTHKVESKWHIQPLLP